MPSSKLILVTRDWSGLGLALLAKSQGSTVVAAYQYNEKEQEDLEETEKIGDGLVDKIPLSQATQKLLSSGNLWMFDGNELPEIAERLRRAGEDIIGTSALSAKMESDRDYAVGVAEGVGLKSPETEKFHDYDAAIKFLEANKDKSYVYKPFKGDPTSTYVPQEREDLAKANSELREYISSLSGNKKPQFILQEVVEGIEAAFDLWLRDGKPILAFCDLEAKRKLTGDLGENIGCAGGYVFKLPLQVKGITDTVGKYLRWKELAHYTGTVDINVIITDKGPLFLENCFRFGYNAYPAMFHGTAKAPVEETLREWVSGKRSDMSGMFETGFAGSLTLYTDNSKSGSPIRVPEAFANRVDIYRAYREEVGLAMVEGWPEIACVVAPARTIEQAGRDCLTLAGKVGFPDKGYRIDLAQGNLPSLPLRRYLSLATKGYLR